MSDDEQTSVDLSGAELSINGETHYVESGTMSVSRDYLRDAKGNPQRITQQHFSIEVDLWEPDEDEQTFIDHVVYAVYEHRVNGDDSLVMIFEDDADTLGDFIDYADRLASGDSRILTGEFHAAKPDDDYLEPGDWYLMKQHGVGISHGLLYGGDE